MIASTAVIVPVPFEVLQEAQDPVERQGLKRHLRQSTRQIVRQEREKQPKPIAVRLDGRGAQAHLERELVDEKRVEQHAEGGGHGIASPMTGAAQDSKR